MASGHEDDAARTRRSSRDSQLTAASSRRAGPAVPTLRLRGLPFAAEAPDVVQFLAAAGVEVAEDQVEMVRMRDGRTTGFAAVAFGEDGYEAAAAAQAKLHMQSVGGRYVEVFLKMVTSSRSAKENTSFESSTASPSDDSRSAFLSSSGSEDITEERAGERWRSSCPSSRRRAPRCCSRCSAWPLATPPGAGCATTASA